MTHEKPEAVSDSVDVHCKYICSLQKLINRGFTKYHRILQHSLFNLEHGYV